MPPYDPGVEEGPTVVDRDNIPCHIYYTPFAKFTIYVVNELRPPETAAQNVEILLFWRAAPNFRVHSLKQSGYNVLGSSKIGNFPKDIKYRLADAALGLNVKARGQQLVWADLVTFMQAGQATQAPLSVAPPAPKQKDVKPMDTTLNKNQGKRSVKEDEYHDLPEAKDVYSPELLVSNTLPERGTLIVYCKPDLPGRMGFLRYFGSLGAIKQDDWVKKNSNAEYYTVYKVNDPFNALSDKVFGYIPASLLNGNRTEFPRTQMESDSSDPTASFRTGLLPYT